MHTTNTQNMKKKKKAEVVGCDGHYSGQTWGGMIYCIWYQTNNNNNIEFETDTPTTTMIYFFLYGIAELDCLASIR